MPLHPLVVAVVFSLCPLAISFGSEKRIDARVAWTVLLKRISGTWKIVHEHTSHVFLDPTD